MSSGARKKLTFDGFLMEMGEAGAKESEGFFTVATRQTVERLKEQYAADPLLGYTEILQGFQELGAECVELVGRGKKSLTLSARFANPVPDLSEVFRDPLNILSATSCLQSGTGLLLLRHAEDRIVWVQSGGRERQEWRFEPKTACFELSDEVTPKLPLPQSTKLGSTWLQLHITAASGLPVYTSERVKSWRDTNLSKEFTNRLAFYGRPLNFRSGRFQSPVAVQCPLPGRLVPHDRWSKSPMGGMGYSWVPMAFHYIAAPPLKQHYFLSEPFTGVVGDKVSLNGRLLDGYRGSSKTGFVSFQGAKNRREASRIPFKRSWWHKSEKLNISGFQSFPVRIANPRMEPPLFRSHPLGHPLVCSRIYMISTAASGPSTLVFVKHGVVLGARHADLGVPGSLALVGVEGLTTDLTRRSIRQNAPYESLVQDVAQEMLTFYRRASQTLGFAMK